MPKQAKGNHKVSALAKAVKTHRRKQPSIADKQKTCLDLKTVVASPEFSLEERGLESGKAVPGKLNAKTALGTESRIGIEHRIRYAVVPIGAALDDMAMEESQILFDDFKITREVQHLMPRRPAWNYELSSGRLHHREVKGFKHWLQEVQQLIVNRGGYPPAFEQNLQVWRQLWRVLELCDVVVIVLDARNPLLHLPPVLVYHVTRTLSKPLVLVLNKLDAVNPSDAVQWAKCLKEELPGVAGVIGHSKEMLTSSDFHPLEIGKTSLINLCHSVFEEIQQITGEKAATDAASLHTYVQASEDVESVSEDNPSAHQKPVMLGIVGQPNVGKSSLINNIMGGKVVSVKATPGHTRTLQTMIVDDHTHLCDSPGVIFPRLGIPMAAQIVGLLIPFAQVREPFSAIRWVMDHTAVPLHESLSLKPVKLQHVLELHEAGTETLALDYMDVHNENEIVPWSPMLLCAQYAIHRGFFKASGPDCFAAGMEILNRIIEGRVAYAVRPCSAFTEHERVSSDPAVCDDLLSSDSDWLAVDEDYETESDTTQPDENIGLVEFFGGVRRTAGATTNRTRRKQKKKMQAKENEGDAAASGDNSGSE